MKNLKGYMNNSNGSSNCVFDQLGKSILAGVSKGISNVVLHEQTSTRAPDLASSILTGVGSQ